MNPLSCGSVKARIALAGAAVALACALAASTATAAVTPNPWLERNFLHIAHQGGEDEFPSNTLYAFRKAVRAGADMLELDIGVTKDGKVIVMHDTTVDGKTNGHGTVSSKTLKQMKRLDAAYWFAPALVIMHDMKPVAAMKASFFACFRNFFTMVVYGIVMFVAGIIAVIPFGLGMLVWVPVAITSTYVAYRQIFTEDFAPAAERPAMV